MQLEQKGASGVLKCKIKKIKSFKPHEKWFLPPDKLQVNKKVIEEALKNAKYSVDPIVYYQDMRARYEKILELEKIAPNCICGIKFGGSICYISTKEHQEGEQ